VGVTTGVGKVVGVGVGGNHTTVGVTVCVRTVSVVVGIRSAFGAAAQAQHNNPTRQHNNMFLISIFEPDKLRTFYNRLNGGKNQGNNP
jgi:hypothetical protein